MCTLSYVVLPVKPTYTIKREIYADKTAVPKQTLTKQNCVVLEVSTAMWLRFRPSEIRRRVTG